nr:replication protein A 70 kDa DNA-binding subunit B-like [Ipomoea batatas]
MVPLYILGRDIAPRNTTSAIKLRLVRYYDVPERRGTKDIKYTECVLHDKEGLVLHSTVANDLVEKFSGMFKESEEENVAESPNVPFNGGLLAWSNVADAGEDGGSVADWRWPRLLVDREDDHKYNEAIDAGAVKRPLLDEFSSTKSSKKTKEDHVKCEKLD